MSSVAQAATGLITGAASEGEKLFGIGKPYQPGAGAFSPGPQEQQYISKLQGLAYGQQPSAAEMQMRQGLDQAQAHASALAASQRGISPALAARLAAQQQAGMAQGVNQNAAILRAQETGQNMGMLGNELQSVRTGQMAGEGIKAQAAENTAQRRSTFFGGLMQGAGPAAMMMHKGGEVPSYAGGGMTMSPSDGAMGGGSMSHGLSDENKNYLSGMLKSGGKGLAKGASDSKDIMMPMPSVMTIQSPQASSMVGQKLSGGYAQGGMIDATSGGKVPGKAQVKGDSIKNDTVPGMLSPGEVVIPRHIMERENAPELAAEFVRGQMQKKSQPKDNYVDGGGVASDDESADYRDSFMEGVQPIADAVSPYVEPFVPSGAGGGIMQNLRSVFGNSQAGASELTPPLTESAPQVPSPQPQMSSQPQMPQQVQSPAAGGLGQVMSGIRNEAKAQGDLGNAQANIYDQAMKEQAKANYKIEQLNWNKAVENENFVNDSRNGDIKPTQYLDSMSTMQKAKTAIGLILGGIGGAITHTENAGLKFLNAQIDRDIEGQRANITQKNNLFKANMDLYHDQITAAMMTKSNLLSLAQAELAAEAAKAQGPLAQARAQQAMGQINGQIQMLNGQASQRQITQDALSDPNKIPEVIKALEVSDPKRAREISMRFVPGSGLATTAEGAKGVKDMQSTIQTAKDSINRLREITNTSGKSFNPNLRAEADSLRNILIGALRVPITGPGAMSEGEREILMNTIPAAADLTSLDSRTRTRLDTLEDSLDRNYKNMLQANNLKPPTSMERQIIKESGGVKYRKVQGGWQRMK